MWVIHLLNMKWKFFHYFTRPKQFFFGKCFRMFQCSDDLFKHINEKKRKKKQQVWKYQLKYVYVFYDVVVFLYLRKPLRLAITVFRLSTVITVFFSVFSPLNCSNHREKNISIYLFILGIIYGSLRSVFCLSCCFW